MPEIIETTVYRLDELSDPDDNDPTEGNGGDYAFGVKFGDYREFFSPNFTWDPGNRRFDAVCVTGAVATVPERFLSWLRPGGRLFVVRGVAPVMEAVLVAAPGDAGGNHRTTSLFETELPYLAGAGPVSRFEL